MSPARQRAHPGRAGERGHALGASEGTLVTPSLNLYAVQNTRLALNLDAFLPAQADGGRDDTHVAFRSQVQIAF